MLGGYRAHALQPLQATLREAFGLDDDLPATSTRQERDQENPILPGIIWRFPKIWVPPKKMAYTCLYRI